MKATHFNGVEYPSLQSAARAAGINYVTVCSRINIMGMSVQDALSIPVKRPAVYTSNGVTATLSEHAARTGVKVASIVKRMQRGESLQAALAYPMRTYRLTPEQLKESNRLQDLRRKQRMREYVLAAKKPLVKIAVTSSIQTPWSLIIAGGRRNSI